LKIGHFGNFVITLIHPRILKELTVPKEWRNATVTAIFQKGNNQILKRQTSRVHYGSKVPAVTIRVFITILEQNR
jgi:hypothetical protein